MINYVPPPPPPQPINPANPLHPANPLNPMYNDGGDSGPMPDWGWWLLGGVGIASMALIIWMIIYMIKE